MVVVEDNKDQVMAMLIKENVEAHLIVHLGLLFVVNGDTVRQQKILTETQMQENVPLALIVQNGLQCVPNLDTVRLEENLVEVQAVQAEVDVVELVELEVLKEELENLPMLVGQLYLVEVKQGNVVEILIVQRRLPIAQNLVTAALRLAMQMVETDHLRIQMQESVDLTLTVQIGLLIAPSLDTVGRQWSLVQEVLENN